jgi:DNA-binding GntR family transcriptional regulator
VPVDHGSAIPPYRQVANVLRARIESGELQPGSRVPSITTLMQQYGIARNTARHALAVLADDGLIEITPGWGSFVKEKS